MSKEAEIRTTPGMTGWIYLVIGTLFFACFVGGVAATAMECAYLNLYAAEPPVIIPRVILYVCAIGIGWFLWHLMDRAYWCLTDVELIGGRRRDTRLSLLSLQKIVIGLPHKYVIPGMELFVSPRIRFESLLLCFSDGSLLPMHLHGLPNGSRLMEELISRHPDRVDQHYKYSEEEIRILRKADVNVLIKKNPAASNEGSSAKR